MHCLGEFYMWDKFPLYIHKEWLGMTSVSLDIHHVTHIHLRKSIVPLYSNIRNQIWEYNLVRRRDLRHLNGVLIIGLFSVESCLTFGFLKRAS